MTEFPARLFTTDDEIERLGEGLLARTLPRAEWTHEAHLAATAYLLLKRPDVDVDRALPGLIRRYNESVGGVNSDSEGYHETITRVFLHGVRLFLKEADRSEPVHELVNEMSIAPTLIASTKIHPSGTSANVVSLHEAIPIMNAIQIPIATIRFHTPSRGPQAMTAGKNRSQGAPP